MFLLRKSSKHVTFAIVLKEIVEVALWERTSRTINIFDALGADEADFIGSDTYNGPVFPVQFVNSDRSISVEFMINHPPLCECGEFRTGNLR